MQFNFKTWVETTDIFGFDAKRAGDEITTDDMLGRPINKFDIELMFEIISRKRIGLNESYSRFVSEVIWGHGEGAVKLECDPGLTFYIRKMGHDRVGNPIWATKRMFQLNRLGFGGLEDAVSQELYEYVAKVYESEPVNPTEYNERDLENLVIHISNKLKRTARDIFVYEGIRRVDPFNYLIKMGLRGHGVEAPDHQRIEENLTQVSYDVETGVIRITNYNVASPVGGPHSWHIHPSDQNLYFFPNQDREEISECLAVHFKYY
jgi:hypothetical protein